MAKVNLKPVMVPLLKAQAAYNSKIGDAEQYLSPFIKFEFSIFYQAGDGFVIVDDFANNAPLDSCLLVIKEKGELTHKDYRSNGI